MKRTLLLHSFLKNMVYPAALLRLGLLGNKCIVKGEIKGEIKEVKEDVKILTNNYTSMKTGMEDLVTRQDELERHYKATVARIFKGCEEMKAGCKMTKRRKFARRFIY